MKKTFVAIIVVLVLLVLGYFIFGASQTPVPVSPVDTDTATSTIVGPNHGTVVNDLVVLARPIDGATVTSPISIDGTARQSMFFEAVFPIKLFDKAGNLIATAQAHATDDWTTNDPVTFAATLVIPTTYEGDATLVFAKDNPSGLPQNDAQISVSIHVVRKTSLAPVSGKACVVSGCSGEICSDTNQVSSCIYRAAFACYKTAKCERQTTGACGWTQSASLKQCLVSAG